MVKTFAFHPFGKTPPDDGAVRGAVKASGTILRMNPDGSDLEVYAWGLRNPFGVAWGPDGKLYASDNGYDERGSRPIDKGRRGATTSHMPIAANTGLSASKA